MSSNNKPTEQNGTIHSQTTAPPTVTTPFDSLLPATRRTSSHDIEIPTMTLEYLTEELCTKRLDDIINHLWMVGRPMPPRPLHYQRLLNREIFVTERMDMHLVWTDGRIFLKPIPSLLLDLRFWSDFLTCNNNQHNNSSPQDCPKVLIRRSALGLLHSYTSLISHPSDFHLAQSHHLLPPEISTFPQWKQFVRELLTPYSPPTPGIRQPTIYQNITPRFRYGELRLSRLNKIYTIARLQPRGYMYRWNCYGGFIRHNLTLLAGVIGYIAIILAALQVGLSTASLAEDRTFQTFSRGFTIFALVGPACVVLLLGCYLCLRLRAVCVSANFDGRTLMVEL